MQPWPDHTIFQWIEHGRAALDPRGRDASGWTGNTVRHLMPDVFEAYVKVFHRLDAYYDNIDNPLSPQEQEVLGLPRCEPLRDLVTRLRTFDGNTRVRWKSVAEALGLPFVAGLSDDWCRAVVETGCWPRYIYGPEDGQLYEEALLELSSLLAGHGHGEVQRCYFRLPKVPFLGTDQPLLYEGLLTDVMAFPMEPSTKNPVYYCLNTPEYWWPPTNDWCVCSDYDLAFTVIGGPRSLLQGVLNSSVLEALEVQPDFRIDVYAPMP